MLGAVFTKMLVLFLFCQVIFGQDTCFTKEEVDQILQNFRDDPNLKEKKAKHFNGGVPIRPKDSSGITLVEGNWDSAIITSRAQKYILEELMGYKVKTIKQVGASGDTYEAIVNETSGEDAAEYAFFTECWDNAEEKKNEFVYEKSLTKVMGTIGADGVEGIFIAMDPSYDNFFGQIGPMEIQAYYDENSAILQELAKVPSTNDLLKSNQEFRKKIEERSGTSPDEILPLFDEFPDTTRPRFDPIGCFEGDTLVKNCFEWHMWWPSWTKNVYQQIVKNLKIPVYITWWGDYYWKIIQLRADMNIPTFFYGWTPEINIANLKLKSRFLLFKPCTKELKDLNDNSNVIGEGGLTCWDAQTDIIKVSSVIKEERATIMEDARAFVLDWFPWNDQIMDQMKVHFRLGADKSHYNTTACTWLKENEAVWLPWLNGEFVATSEPEMPLELILLVFVGMIVVIVGMVYGAHHFGLFVVISDALIGDTSVAVIEFVWKCVDYTFTWLLFFELEANEEIDDSFKIIYLCFATSHTISFVLGIYFCIISIYTSCTDDHECKDLRNEPMAQRNQRNITYSIERSNLDMYCAAATCLTFFLEDIPGVVILVYATMQYDQEINITFILGFVMQCVEFGMNVGSPVVLAHRYGMHVSLEEEEVFLRTSLTDESRITDK